eukprot:IDg23421t1
MGLASRIAGWCADGVDVRSVAAKRAHGFRVRIKQAQRFVAASNGWRQAVGVWKEDGRGMPNVLDFIPAWVPLHHAQRRPARIYQLVEIRDRATRKSDCNRAPGSARCTTSLGSNIIGSAFLNMAYIGSYSNRSRRKPSCISAEEFIKQVIER